MKLSIIIPIYNAEKHLRPCLESIFTQNVHETEIICVNDGSTDNSLGLLHDIQAIHDNLIIIDKENGGVSSARNAGIEKASGEWIMFVDADDALTIGSLEKCLDYAERSRADMVMFGFKRIARNNVETDNGFEPRILSSENEILGYLRKRMPGEIESCWAKLYRTAIIRDSHTRFPRGVKMYEDGIFNYELLSKVSCVALSDIILYVYRTNETGATSKFHAESFLHDIAAYYNALTGCLLGDKPETDAGSLSKVNIHVAYCMILQLYTIYRAPSGDTQIQWLKRYVSAYDMILPGWHNYISGGLPSIISRLIARKLYWPTHIVIKTAISLHRIKRRFTAK